MTRVAFFLLFFWFTPAFAQSGDELLKESEKLLSEGNLDEAFTKLSESIAKLGDNNKKGRVHMLLGIIYLASDDIDNTRREFAISIKLRPEHHINDTQFAPDVVQLFNQERNRLVGSISISTDNDESPQPEIYFNGDLKGLSPVVLEDILVGEYTIKIVKKGYKDIERRELVKPSERRLIHLELQVDDKLTPKIVHKKGESAIDGTSYRVRAEVTDNVGLEVVTLYYRMKNGKKFSEEPMVKVQEGVWEGIVSSEKMKGEKLQYYITASDSSGNRATEGNSQTPFEIQVVQLDRVPPVIFHEVVMSTSDASELNIDARVIENKLLDAVVLGYRRGGEDEYIVEKMSLKEKAAAKDGEKETKSEIEKDIYTLKIPDSYLKTSSLLEYFIQATDATGNKQYAGRPDSPNPVTVYSVAPYFEGFIVERKERKKGKPGKEVIINLGTAAGVKKGDIFTVFRAGDCDNKPFKGCVKDPQTGEVLKIDQVVTGKIKLIDPGPRSSKATVLKENKKDRISVNHKIRRRPGSVRNVSGISRKLRQIELHWSESPEPETEGYYVYRSISPDSVFKRIKVIKGRSKKRMFDKGGKKVKFADETMYFYKVSAYNKEKAEGEQSKPVGVMTKGGPNPPGDFKAVSNEVRKIALSWSLAEDKDAKGYVIQYAAKPDGPFTEAVKIKTAQTIKTVIKSTKETPLLDGQKYYLKILSFNRVGKNGNPSQLITAATRGKPQAVTGLQVVGERVRLISLKWDMHSDPDVVSYNIHRSKSKDGGFETVGRITSRTVTEFSDKGTKSKLKDGAAYYYSITAVRKGEIESDLSELAKGVTTGAPETPSGFRVAGGKVKKVILGWEKLSKSEVAGYIVYRSGDGEEFKLLKKIIGKSKNQLIDSKNLKDGTKYYYRLVAYNIVNVESTPTETLEAVTKPTPGTPQGLVAADGEARQTHLTWQGNPETDIKGYRLWRSMNADSGFAVLARIKASETSYNDLRLKDGTQYYYRLTAVDNDSLVSELSDTVFITTKLPPESPSQPSATPGKTTVALTWDASQSEGVVSYNVYSKGFFSPKKIGATSETSFVIEGLTPNQTFTFFVTAVDDTDLESKLSPGIKATTLQ